MSYLRMYQGPKKEKELRKQERQRLEESKVIRLPASPVKEVQKPNWLEAVIHYLIILAVIGVALGLASLEVYMGGDIARAQSSDPNNQMVLGWFNRLSALMTLLLPYVSMRNKSLWIIWVLFFTYSTYNTYTWLHQNWSDATVAKEERRSPEIIALENRYAIVLRKSQDECSTGKKGSQRGDLCHQLESEAKDVFNKLQSLEDNNKQDAITDPRNTAVANLFGVSIELIKKIISVLVSFIPPSGGLVLKFAIRAIALQSTRKSIA